MDNPIYSSEDGILFSRSKDLIIAYPGGKCSDTYFIPECTETIAGGAFCGCQHLRSVTIHSNVTEIGAHAIWFPQNLQEIHLRNEHPENIKIDERAFIGLTQCTLFVPIGTGYAYRHDKRFKGKFKEVKIEK